MPHDVFVSHSSSDKAAADAVVHGLEAAGIRCWVAPRDVPPGANYQGTIVRAIRESKLIVLIYSAHADSSRHVLRELASADDEGLPILPFRIEDAPMGDDMAYYLRSPHWLDALTRPFEDHVKRLVHAVKKTLGRSSLLSEIPQVDADPPPSAPPPDILAGTYLGQFFSSGSGQPHPKDNPLFKQRRAERRNENAATLKRAEEAYSAGRYEEARRLAEIVAYTGHNGAMVMLAHMYEEGKGGAVALDKAKEWYGNAAGRGDSYGEMEFERLAKRSNE